MYKRNKHQFHFFLRAVFTFSIIFSCFSFSFSFAATPLKVTDAITQVIALFKKWGSLELLQKKPIIKNMYSESLKVIDATEVSTLFATLQKTADSINTRDADDPIPDKQLCSLTAEDILTVVYQEDSDFRRTIKHVVGKNIQWTVEEPTKDKYIEVCKKFTQCWNDVTTYTETIASRKFCKEFILQNYQLQHTELLDISSFTDVNYGDEFFWNMSLADSDYDIMSDVYALAKVLFAWVKEPIETVFYSFPTLTNQRPVDDSVISSDSRIDWFLPYPESLYVCTWGICDIPPSLEPVVSSSAWWSSWWPSGAVSAVALDPQTLSFLEQTNTLYKNDTSTLEGNQCVGDWIILEEPEELITQRPWEDYVEEVLATISELACNQDAQCDATEDCTCSDCKDDVKCANETCPTDGICSETEACSCPDCVEDPLPSCVAWYYTWLTNVISGLQNTWSPEIQDEVKWCLQTCNDMKTSFTALWSDILVCYARCACGTFESPLFDASQFPWLTNSFKIEFCMIPPQENAFTRNKKVNTLEEILVNMKNVLQDLRDGWQMRAQTKTKEFLDSSLIKNNFAKQFSFTINYQEKSLFADKSALTQTQEQQEVNKILQTTVLQMWSDITLDSERNKYVVFADPCVEKVENNATTSDINDCRELSAKKIPSLVQSPITTFQDQKITLLDEEVGLFLQKNVEFWINVRGMFEEMNQIAKNLEKK